MAYWIVKKNATGSTCVTEFIMDSDDDLENLPNMEEEGVDQGDGVSHRKVDKGSIVFSIESSSSYMLNSDNEWTAYTSGSGGGGGSTGSIIRIKKFTKNNNTYEWVDTSPVIGNVVLPVYIDENDEIHYPSTYSDSDAYYSYTNSAATTLTSLHFSFNSDNPTLINQKSVNLLELVMD